MGEKIETIGVPRVEWWWLITLQLPMNGGIAQSTLDGSFTCPETWTAVDRYRMVREQITKRAGERWLNANPIMYHIEPMHS